jgi:hypothetical protein
MSRWLCVAFSWQWIWEIEPWGIHRIGENDTCNF